MIVPPSLKKDSTIRIPVPASPIRESFINNGLDRLIRQGWSPEKPATGYDSFFYCAGPDAERADLLVDALSDPIADAVWFARGGYGSGRLLSFLDHAFPEPPSHPKIIIGCSDTSFVLIYALQRWKWMVFHGPMVAGDLAGDETRCDFDYLFSLLEGRPIRHEVSSFPLDVIQEGPSVSAPVTGGCLSALTATLGTEYELETDGHILFLEDAYEKPYQLDRMLTQMKHAGKLKNCAGIVFGQMPGCTQHPEQGYSIQEALRFALDDLECPILFGLPSGHSTSPAVPIALGAFYKLDMSRRNLILEDQRLCHFA